MTIPLAPDVPSTPICRAEDGVNPCRFATSCSEMRQRRHHYSSPPLRGRECWAFTQLEAKFGTEAQAERAAIQSEPAA